jgi:hypothetical protein
MPAGWDDTVPEASVTQTGSDVGKVPEEWRLGELDDGRAADHVLSALCYRPESPAPNA